MVPYKISSSIPKEDEPEYWDEQLQPLLSELNFGIYFAVQAAHRFFEDRPVNRPVLSALIRYYLSNYLTAHHYGAKEEVGDPDDWNMRSLANNGIELRYKGSRIRIRKATGMPAPMTASSRDYYQQIRVLSGKWLAFESSSRGSVILELR